MKAQARVHPSVSQPARRVARLFEHDEDLDAVLLINGPHDPSFFWATGLHEGGTFERSAAILRPDERPLVLTTKLEETTARKSENTVKIYDDEDDFWEQVTEELGGDDVVGIDHERITLDRYDSLKDHLDPDALTDASDALERARLIKDPDEVDRIENACQITDEIAEAIPQLATETDTEGDLAAEIVHRIRKASATLSFEPIVASGPASAEPHYQPGAVPLREGALLVDMGAKLNGYCSDITRTYANGEPPESLQRMHEVVLDAQKAALDAIQPGTEAKAIHQAAADVIDATEFKGRFIHSLGHSLGVEVHDGPGLSSRSEVTLEEGMVFTVEPGVYVPDDAGVRIEEDIVVTQDGCRRLTSADRSLTRV